MVEDNIAFRWFGDPSDSCDPALNVQTESLGGEETSVHPDDPGPNNGKSRRQC